MSRALGVAALTIGLLVFGLWQFRENAARGERLKAQAERIEALERTAGIVDKALQDWRRENAAITVQRRETRERTRAVARKNPTFQEALDAPLPVPLRSAAHGGFGLLGGPGRAGPAPGADAADPRP